MPAMPRCRVNGASSPLARAATTTSQTPCTCSSLLGPRCCARRGRRAWEGARVPGWSPSPATAPGRAWAWPLTAWARRRWRRPGSCPRRRARGTGGGASASASPWSPRRWPSSSVAGKTLAPSRIQMDKQPPAVDNFPFPLFAARAGPPGQKLEHSTRMPHAELAC